MPILKNSRHEKFAQAVAAGEHAGTAYIQAGYETTSPYVQASVLIRKPMVAARIAELKERACEKADITRAEIIKILANYARSHPDDYPHDTRLRAIAQLTKMTGWDAPDKVELSADNELAQLINRLRGGG